MSTKALQEKASRIICSLFKKSDLNRSQYFSWYSRNYNKRCWIHCNWGPLQNYPIHQNYFQWILLQSVTHVRGIFLICKLWTSAPELRGNGPFSASRCCACLHRLCPEESVQSADQGVQWSFQRAGLEPCCICGRSGGRLLRLSHFQKWDC